MLVETPYFGGIINPKTNLNHVGSKFFFLSSLANKLLNLLVFKNISCKWARTDFLFNYRSGTNFTYEFEVCYIVVRNVSTACANKNSDSGTK